MQFHFHIVKSRFGDVHQGEFGRAHLRYLAHELTANATRSAGDQYTLARDERSHFGLIQIDHGPSQQVFDAHLLDLSGAQLPIDPIVHRWNGEHAHFRREAGINNTATVLSIRLSDGDDHLVHFFTFEQCGQALGGMDQHTLQSFACFARVVVHEGQHFKLRRTLAIQCALGDQPGFTGTVYDHTHAFLARTA